MQANLTPGRDDAAVLRHAPEPRHSRNTLLTGCDVACAQANFDALVFLSNATAAFGLNMAVFLLIGKTSALTMNVAGVIKDWLLIGLSVAIFKAQVPLFGPLGPS
jgi:hypothetical protein